MRKELYDIKELPPGQTIRDIYILLQSLCEGDVVQINRRELEMINAVRDLISHHLPLAVTEYTAYLEMLEDSYYYYEICPKCGGLLERTYQAHCDKCGQRLRWISKKAMTWKIGQSFGKSNRNKQAAEI